jgi:methyl-accepting chemotaxis protein
MKWFYNLKMAKKICLLVFVMLLFLLISSILGYYYTTKVSNSSESLYNNNLKPISWLNQSLYLAQANKAELIKIINENSYPKKQAYILNIGNRAKSINENIALYTKSSLDDEEKKNLYAFNEAVKVYREKRTTMINLALSGKMNEARASFAASEGAIDKFSDILKDLAKHSENKANKINVANKKDSSSALKFIFFAGISGFGLSLMLGMFISSIISKPLAKAVHVIEEVADGNLNVEKLNADYTDEVGVLSTSLNTMIGNLYNLVSQVTMSIDEISSSSEEMSAATEQTAQGAQLQANNSVVCLDNINAINNLVQIINNNVEDTVKYSKSTEENADKGKTHSENAIIKINQIKTLSNETAGNIQELSKLSSDIELIVDLIKDIANKTNLLALNAAIEAARAGELGKGFAVVADEVKKLACQSVDATDKITKMIKEIQIKTTVAVESMGQGVKNVEDGVLIIQEVGHSLDEIYENAKLSTSNVNEISSDVNNLAINSNNVVRMVTEITSVTEEQSASLQQISASTVSLTKISEKLQDIVKVFKI